MKKKLLLCILFLCSMSVFAEKRMVINFKASKVFDIKIDFIDEQGYIRYNSFMESLLKGKKVYFDSIIPKTGIIEGDYQIVIYEDNKIYCSYNIISDDYVYNENKKCFQKVPNVLNNLRAILYIEYLRSIKKNSVL